MALGDYIYNRPDSYTDDVFADRDLNFFNNAWKDLKDFGGGISTLVSYIPQIARGEANITLPEFGQAVWQGMKEQYGQQNGWDLGNAVKSFYYHPSNILDVLPILKAAGVTGTAGRALTGAFPQAAEALGRASDLLKAGSYVSDPATIARKTEALTRYNRMYGIADNGMNADIPREVVQGLYPANEPKFIPFRNSKRGFTQGQMSTWGVEYDMMKEIPVEYQQRIKSVVNQKYGIQSSKELSPELLPDYLDDIRGVYNNAINNEGSTGAAALSPERIDAFMHKNMKLVPYTPPEGQYHGLEVPLKKMDTMFKKGVLASPAWIVGNRGGNWTLNAMEGVSPVDYWDAMHDFKNVLPKKALGGFYGTSEGAVTDAFKIGNKIADTATKPLSKWSDFWFGLEQKLEYGDRSANMVFQLKQDAAQALRAEGLPVTKTNVFAKAKELARTEAGQLDALKSVDASLGGYGLGNEFQRHMSLYVPFWRWYRALGQTTANQAINHPIKFQALRRLAATGAMISDEQKRELEAAGYNVPEYARYGAVDGVDEKGNPIINNAGKLSPYSTFTQIGNAALNFPSSEAINMLNPALRLTVNQTTGTNFTGQPATAPHVVNDFLGGKRYFVNPETGIPEPLVNDQLPAEYKMPYLFSDIARTYTPLGVAERWLPYKSYDSFLGVRNPVFQEGGNSIDLLKQTGFQSSYPLRKANTLSASDRKRLRKRDRKLYGGV